MQEFLPQAMEFARNHTIMVIAWLAVFVAVIVTNVKSATSKAKVIDNAQLTQLINKHNGVVVDVRSDEEFARGHIAGSVQALPSEIKGKHIPVLEKYKSVPVIVVDSAGLDSVALANTLYKQGFSQVYSLKEGISSWNGANLPLVKH